jgi:hypothetical protein
MSDQNLISQLFNKRECNGIRKLYKDESSRRLVYDVIANKLFDSEKPVWGKPLDLLTLILAKNSFGASDEEVVNISAFIFRSIFYTDPLPYLTECPSLEFSIKTLTSLSFHYDKMERRTEKFAAPKPEYYRATSQTILRYNGYDGIAEKHQNWESFLIEAFPS